MSSRAAVAAFLDRPTVSRFLIAVILVNAVLDHMAREAKPEAF